MTVHNKFLHIMNLCLNLHEKCLTKQRAIPKGPKYHASAELTTACTFVFILGFTISVTTMGNA